MVPVWVTASEWNAADREIDTCKPVAATVDEILRISESLDSEVMEGEARS